MRRIQLGLIGDNIRASRAPALHRFCGQLTGLDVSYDLFIPPDMGMSFDQVFARCHAAGLRGINITLPYKEKVLEKLSIEDPEILRIGSSNTVLFGKEGPRGFNTDFSGFVRAWRERFGDRCPGQVVMFGAGGVGKAVAYGLSRLRAEAIILIDRDHGKAEALAAGLNAGKTGVPVARPGTFRDLAGADGVINCTPLGMTGYGGTPVPEAAFPQAGWAFDAVYTPIETPFRAQALAAGAEFLSGYELFYWQGVEAYEIFTGVTFSDHGRLRRMLLADTAGNPA